MTTPIARKGQAPARLTHDEFRQRFLQDFDDPAFDAEKDAVDRLAEIAWQAYSDERKSPRTEKAGAGFADPGYDLSIEWRANSDALKAAQKRWEDPATPSRVLLVIGSARNDGTCPGEISKTYRMTRMAKETLDEAGIETDVLDLSLLTSDYKRHIHPCKGCVSTAMPLCHWPCSCYPNHSLGQTNDWMAEIYERWVSAHGVMLVTPVYWYQAPSPLKQMIDRLVCADGGNPDPSSTHGKTANEAKQIEMDGWNYPKHLEGRAYGVVVHGDVAGIESVRRGLSDWLDWMGFIDAGGLSRIDRYIGYYEPYATSHEALDRDTGVQQEVRNVAKAVGQAVKDIRAGTLKAPDRDVKPARPK